MSVHLVNPSDLAARWDLMPRDEYMWASVQTIRGCPKHCSFYSVWRTDGQQPRQRQFQSVIDEIVNRLCTRKWETPRFRWHAAS
jgi:radical SAM superfamily enzyme YgiQ (UPF0313 family)